MHVERLAMLTQTVKRRQIMTFVMQMAQSMVQLNATQR